MSANAEIHEGDLGALRIIHYPDPRLREVCTPIDVVDGSVQRLVERMFELMFESRGLGLAGSQVGVTVRLFVASPSFESTDRRVYVNPEILSTDGTQDAEEGCLSFPGINCKIKRPKIVTIRAKDLEGEVFEETGEDLAARVLLHELDHLDGRLLVDRMGSVARLTNRGALKGLEEAFENART